MSSANAPGQTARGFYLYNGAGLVICTTQWNLLFVQLSMACYLHNAGVVFVPRKWRAYKSSPRTEVRGELSQLKRVWMVNSRVRIKP